MPKIEVTQLLPPSMKKIELPCPNPYCGLLIARWVPIPQKGGEIECPLCGTLLKWKELPDD